MPLPPDPNSLAACNDRGLALMRSGQFDDAVAAFRFAVARWPGSPQLNFNLGIALNTAGQLDAAISAYRQAIALKPAYALAHNNLGNALRDKGQLDEAVAALRQAIVLNPNDAEIHSNLGASLKDQGYLDAAIAAFRQAISIDPANAAIHSNLVYTLHFHPAFSAPAILAEHRRWNDLHARPLAAQIAPHDNDRSPNRRLRIGYVSPHFRNHCQSHFTLPLLSNHDHAHFEIICYSSVGSPDAITQRLTAHADAWQNVASLSDADLAEKIRRDRIDILVDLTMHMSPGRPRLFARKPAPVQVAFLAYPGTTGIETIDYRLTDPHLDPPENDSHYSEISIRLPDTFWCYDPLAAEPPVNNLPALAALPSGHITFGCLNNFCKINDPVLALWADVLRRVIHSRLLLLSYPGSHRQRTIDRLSEEGIDPARIEFASPRPREQYLQLYHRIDIGLDTFPYNGHTTSLDSFWMGVPVVTLVGQTAVSRAGLCQLSNLGLSELAARSPDEFVRTAVKLSGDLPRLQELRSTLRQHMHKSPLMDAPRFAQNIEAAYRGIWHTWRQTPSAGS
jgi:protein O-GlcNAc transferase